MRTVYGDHQRFIDTYFSQVPGYYFTGDGARRDEDGYYWITGRVDDVLNLAIELAQRRLKGLLARLLELQKLLLLVILMKLKVKEYMLLCNINDWYTGES